MRDIKDIRATIRAYVRDNYVGLTDLNLDQLRLSICHRVGIELEGFEAAYPGGFHELLEEIWPLAYSIAQIGGASPVTLGEPKGADKSLDLLKKFNRTWYPKDLAWMANVIGPQPSDWHFR